MGNSQSTQKINYEDVQYVIKNSENHILINTLNESEQDCLIPHTLNIHKETDLINKFIKGSPFFASAWRCFILNLFSSFAAFFVSKAAFALIR